MADVADYYSYALQKYNGMCEVANPVSDCAYFYEDLKQVKFWLADANAKLKTGGDAKEQLASLKIAVAALQKYAPPL